MKIGGHGRRPARAVGGYFLSRRLAGLPVALGMKIGGARSAHSGVLRKDRLERLELFSG